jgi:hypothetical protein
MTEWLLKTAGVSDQLLKSGEVRFDFQHWKVFWVGLALLLPLSYFIFRWQRRNLTNTPPALRIALSLTRVLVLALLVVVLASPILKADQEREKRPIVAFLFDYSQSMQLPAGPFESEDETVRIARAAGYQAPDGKLDADARKALNRISRGKLAQTVVQTSAKAVLEPLAKKFDVQIYSFAKDPARLAVDAAHPQLPEPPAPGGPSSHLGDAIAHVLNEAGGREVAGILLFSDGQNTGGRSPAEAAQAAAAAGAPLYTVPVGTPSRLRDVAIVDVFTSGLVAVGDTVRVAVTIESQGFDQRPVKVELRDGDKLLDVKDLVLHSTEQQQLDLTFQAKDAGARYLTVGVGEVDPATTRVKPLPEEPEHLRGNNTDVAFVRVTDEKLRVLYLEGLPRWDFRFLKNAMRRDHGLAGYAAKEPEIVLEAEWRRLPPAQQSAALLRNLDELAKYHTIILGDVSPTLLNPEFVKLLDQAVRERGVGLVVAAGPLHMPQEFDETLRNLLPVRLDDKAAAGYLPRNAAKPFHLELTPEGSVHEAMRFYDDPGRNQNAWAYLPPLYWCVAAERPAPGASVLVWESQYPNRYGKLPAVAYHYAGKGKVLLVGTDSTWLWRQNVGDRFFYKFWGQGLRFVARRDQADSKKSRIEVRPVRAQPGEQAQVEVMSFAPDGSPRGEPTLTAQVLAGDTASAVELTADTANKGRYTGNFPLPTTGEYRVSFDPGSGAEAVEAKIRVLDSSEELRHPNVNRPALQQLAGLTKDVGGKDLGGMLVELPDLAGIPDRLKGDTKVAASHREATIWDNWLTLAVLVFIYSLDVGLRRLAGLS